MKNTISYKDLNDYYLCNDTAIANARKYFGTEQPNIHSTGFYSSPSWNWAYLIGIAGIKEEKKIRYFEVVTQFGEVKAAREIYIPIEPIKE